MKKIIIFPFVVFLIFFNTGMIDESYSANPVNKNNQFFFDFERQIEEGNLMLKLYYFSFKRYLDETFSVQDIIRRNFP